jgi:hypothetical protein
MIPFFGTTAIVIAALTAPSAPASTDAVQAAPVTAPVVASVPSRRRGRHQQAVTMQQPGPSSDQEAIEEQIRMRVLMPALSGDGGG